MIRYVTMMNIIKMTIIIINHYSYFENSGSGSKKGRKNFIFWSELGLEFIGSNRPLSNASRNTPVKVPHTKFFFGISVQIPIK